MSIDDLFACTTGPTTAATFSKEAMLAFRERVADPEYAAAERRLFEAQRESLIAAFIRKRYQKR